MVVQLLESITMSESTLYRTLGIFFLLLLPTMVFAVAAEQKQAMANAVDAMLGGRKREQFKVINHKFDTGGEFPKPEIDADTRAPRVSMERPVTETPLSHVCAPHICANRERVTGPLRGAGQTIMVLHRLTRCSAVVSCSCSWCSGWP